MAVPPPPRSNFVKRLVTAWETTQVELHGQYSLERLKDFQAHASGTAWWKTMAAYMLTPIPCLVVVALLDCFKLEPADIGAMKSLGYWIRLYGILAVFAIMIVFELKAMVPALMISTRKVLVPCFVIQLIGLPVIYGWARLIGFPVPFTIHLTSLVSMPAFAVFFLRTYGAILRSSPEVKNDVKTFIIILNCLTSFTFIYPIYAAVFIQLSSHAQTAFALLLPWIKIGAKNIISRLLGDLDDMKPTNVIFNVEIFNALFVSLCMGNSTSILTTVVLIGVDLVQMWLSLYDMKNLVQDLNTMLDKMPLSVPASVTGSTATGRLEHVSARPRQRRHNNALAAAIEILEIDNEISRHSSLQQACRHSTLKKLISMQPSVRVASASNIVEKSSSHARSGSAIAPATTDAVATSDRVFVTRLGDTRNLPNSTRPALDPATAPTETPADPKPLLSSTDYSLKQADDAASVKLGLNALERLQFVQKITKILFMTEYAVLVEYTEVVTPLVYCSYTLLMYYLPNRAYYPQIAHLSPAGFFGNLQNVLLYSLLELISFFVMVAAIKRQLGFSPTHQLSFVLMRQWHAVQTKFMIWVMYVPQLYLFHFGVDFSFQFKWLTKQPAPGE